MPLLPLPESRSSSEKSIWSGLSGSSIALAVGESAQRYDGLTLLIAESVKKADQLEAEIRFFIDASNTDNAAEQLPILHFPDQETLPYDLFSPHQDITSERLKTLYNLPSVKRGVLIVPVTTLMHRLPPRSFIDGNVFAWRVGEPLNIRQLRARLDQAGYHLVETVYEHGDYAVRGALIDVFPMGSSTPIRIDLFDDEIETLRSFDVETQLTISQLQSIQLLPAREVPLDSAGIKVFKDNWNGNFDADPRRSTLYQDVSEGIPPQGIEYYLPLFFPEPATLFDYLPERCQVLVDGALEAVVEQYWREIQHRYREYGVDPTRPLVAPTDCFIPSGEIFHHLKQYPRIQLSSTSCDRDHAIDFALPSLPDISTNPKIAAPLRALEHFLTEHDLRVLFCAESPGRRELLLEMLAPLGIKPENISQFREFVDNRDIDCGIVVYPLGRGLMLPAQSLCVITETELFGQQVLQRRRRSRDGSDPDQIIKNLSELRIGAPVVHIDNGVGRYLGLQTLTVGGDTQEFLVLEYADDAKLYVPVSSLHLISRYSAAEETAAPLHRLGSEQWQKAREKAVRQIRDSAAELLEVYARRAARNGFAAQPSQADYRAFCAEFPFEETPDQRQAIDAVKQDMEARQPMDRLVCGDVGFGKTEVAMRAAFLAVSSGKQVMVLVPTTLLAHQHVENFRDRFANWPVSVEELSRFKTAKHQQQVISRAAAGRVDILIGTHKLLQGDLNIKNLGLLVIDEEHRFGVRQKEKFKALRSQVDILTMTATPIPRTLNMSMSGIRDLSIIATPPARRLSVKTFVRQQDPRIVKEAILREILRGGQVFYLHNEVKNIEQTAREIRELIPEARVEIGHGQMRERALENVMSDFYHQRFNVLVCTTIVETGIDIPSANTIIIDRADKFGLAQLHQLRGRVGRSHHQAYAYLLTPHPRAMTADAVKRLEAIEAADHLGSGFTLATHDLEIRGAGELLGEEQSGHIQAIGFSLYMELLDRAVNGIKSGKVPTDDTALMENIDVNLNIPALIPEDYLPDVHTRLVMYKRISAAEHRQALHELQVEMIDRFGLLPEQLKNLFRVMEIKNGARKLGINKIEAGDKGGRIDFSNDTVVEPLTIVQLVQRSPQQFSLQGASSLLFKQPLTMTEQRIDAVTDVLAQLTPEQLGAKPASETREK